MKCSEWLVVHHISWASIQALIELGHTWEGVIQVRLIESRRSVVGLCRENPVGSNVHNRLAEGVLTHIKILPCLLKAEGTHCNINQIIVPHKKPTSWSWKKVALAVFSSALWTRPLIELIQKCWWAWLVPNKVVGNPPWVRLLASAAPLPLVVGAHCAQWRKAGQPATECPPPSLLNLECC